MKPSRSNFPLVSYALWLGLIAWTMRLHWIYPLIVFALGAVILHNSAQGGPLRALVEWVRAQRRVDLRRAQQLTFGAGFLTVLACTPVVAMNSLKVEEHRFEAQRLEAQAAQQREAAARAEQAAAEAKRAAAKAEAERIKAAQAAAAAKVAEQRRAQWEADDRRREAEQAEQKRQDDAQRAEQVRQDKDRQEQEAAQQEAVRRTEEGPWTREQAREMCQGAVAQQYGVPRNYMIEQGSVWEQLNNGPQNTHFGEGRLWFWRPTYKLVGSETEIAVLCRVYESGRVEIENQ